MRRVYLWGAVVGTILPFTFLVRFLATNGFDVVIFARQLFQNNVALFFAMDVLVSAVMLWVFIRVEGRKQRMGYLWTYVLCTLLVGVSLALPLFLFFRERKLLTLRHD